MKDLFYFSIDQLIESRLHLASSVKIWYKEFYYWIYGIRSGLFVIDLVKSIYGLKSGLHLIEHFSFYGAGVCFSIQNKFLFTRFSLELDRYIKLNLTYLTRQWLPGFLTNFRVFKKHLLPQIRKYACIIRADKFKLFNPKWRTFYKVVKGLRYTFEVPSVVCFLTVRANESAINETFKLMIPSIGLVDTDVSCLTKVTYPVLGNDDSIGTLLFLFMAFKNSFLIGVLKKKRYFLFLINSVLSFLRKKEIYFLFDQFILIYFFIGNLFSIIL